MIVLVTGAPATGKSTLARLLGDTLSWPVVHRDEIKSGLSTIGTPEVAGKAFDVWFEVLTVLARRGSHVIGEAAMHRDPSTPSARALTEVGEVRIVHCGTPLALDRYVARGQRHSVHDDVAQSAKMRSPGFDWSVYEAVEIGAPVLPVVTTDGYQPGLDEILRFVTGAADRE